MPNIHLLGSMKWPDNSMLRGTASSYGLFSHCREQQYQGTAAVWQECDPSVSAGQAAESRLRKV